MSDRRFAYIGQKYILCTINHIFIRNRSYWHILHVTCHFQKLAISSRGFNMYIHRKTFRKYKLKHFFHYTKNNFMQTNDILSDYIHHSQI